MVIFRGNFFRFALFCARSKIWEVPKIYENFLVGADYLCWQNKRALIISARSLFFFFMKKCLKIVIIYVPYECNEIYIFAGYN